jgi:hypothetical protein
MLQWCFRGAYCLHHQGDEWAPLKHRPTSTWRHSATSQKTAIFILLALWEPQISTNNIVLSKLLRLYLNNITHLQVCTWFCNTVQQNGQTNLGRKELALVVKFITSISTGRTKSVCSPLPPPRCFTSMISPWAPFLFYFSREQNGLHTLENFLLGKINFRFPSAS